MQLVFHGIGGLVEVVHQKTQANDALCLYRRNDLKRLVRREGTIDIHKQLLLAILSREAKPPASDGDTDHMIGPPRKRARQSGDDVVGVTFLGIYQTMLTDLLRVVHLLVLIQVHLCNPIHG